MSKDGRGLREEAAAATAAGKYKKALAAYLELERLEPRDAQWAKRAAEIYRRLGKDGDAIDAYARATDRYAQNGFLVQAIAVCKLILQIDPEHDATLRRLAQINELIGTTSTRAGALAENNPALYEDPNVAEIRRANTTVPPFAPKEEPRRQKISSNPPLTVSRTKSPVPIVARTKSRPIKINPGSALDSLELSDAVPGSHARDKSNPAVRVIPIDAYMEALDFETEDKTTEAPPRSARTTIDDSDFEPTQDRPRDVNPVVVSDEATGVAIDIE